MIRYYDFSGNLRTEPKTEIERESSLRIFIEDGIHEDELPKTIYPVPGGLEVHCATIHAVKYNLFAEFRKRCSRELQLHLDVEDISDRIPVLIYRSEKDIKQILYDLAAEGQPEKILNFSVFAYIHESECVGISLTRLFEKPLIK